MKLVKGYPVAMEVEAVNAMWRRPDSGDNPTSYPVAPMSQATGAFASIALLKRPGANRADAEIWPYRIEVCSPIRFEMRAIDNTGVGKKPSKPCTQVFSEVLFKVCYKIYGVSFSDDSFGKAHFLQELFMRRLRKGQCFVWPYMGQEEFLTTYFGPIRSNTRKINDSVEVGPMPLTPYCVLPVNCWKNSSIEEGTLNYADQCKVGSRLVEVAWSF